MTLFSHPARLHCLPIREGTIGVGWGQGESCSAIECHLTAAAASRAGHGACALSSGAPAQLEQPARRAHDAVGATQRWGGAATAARCGPAYPCGPVASTAAALHQPACAGCSAGGSDRNCLTVHQVTMGCKSTCGLVHPYVKPYVCKVQKFSRPCHTAGSNCTLSLFVCWWLALFAQDLLLSALLASLTACPLGACRACWEVTPRRQGGGTAPRPGTPAA